MGKLSHRETSSLENSPNGYLTTRKFHRIKKLAVRNFQRMEIPSHVFFNFNEFAAHIDVKY